jgi:hypothetical protein
MDFYSAPPLSSSTNSFGAPSSVGVGGHSISGSMGLPPPAGSIGSGSIGGSGRMSGGFDDDEPPLLEGIHRRRLLLLLLLIHQCIIDYASSLMIDVWITQSWASIPKPSSERPKQHYYHFEHLHVINI